MDTFIVRIYRRIARGAEEPAGTVEHVETGERVAFSDARQLLTRLLMRRRHDGAARENAPDRNDDKPTQD
jgi:hypothetical protein